MSKYCIVVKGVSSSGKSTRVYLFLKFLRDMVGFKFEPFLYNQKEIGLLCLDLDLLFIGKEYDGNGITRWQGLDSRTGVFGSNAAISDFIRDTKHSTVIEGAGTTQSHRFRPKYLNEYCGIDNIFIQYYSYPADGKDFYLKRVLSRTGRVPNKPTMWEKNNAYLKELNKSLVEAKEIGVNSFVCEDMFDAPAWDLGVKVLEFLGLGDFCSLFVEFCNSCTYVEDNVYKD